MTFRLAPIHRLVLEVVSNFVTEATSNNDMLWTLITSQPTKTEF